MSTTGWETLAILVGILALGLGSLRIHRPPTPMPARSSSTLTALLWTGTILFGLIVVLPLLLLNDGQALLAAGLFSALLVLGSLAILDEAA